MEIYTLTAQPRTAVGNKQGLLLLREKDFVPAVVYGHNSKNQHLQMKYHDFEKIYRAAGESSLISLFIEGQDPVSVKIQNIQRDPYTDAFVHADFYQVRMDEKMKANIELHFIGESKAVKELGGILVKNLESVEVECLPKDLVHDISVDISRLENFGDALHVRDLSVPSGVEILNSPENIVASVSETKEEKEEPAATEVVQPIVEEKGKKAKEGEAEEGGEES